MAGLGETDFPTERSAPVVTVTPPVVVLLDGKGSDMDAELMVAALITVPVTAPVIRARMTTSGRSEPAAAVARVHVTTCPETPQLQPEALTVET
jgi:hypothetical protein